MGGEQLSAPDAQACDPLNGCRASCGIQYRSAVRELINTGWTPVLPTLPAFRRIFALPELSWRYDPTAAPIVLIPYEWGFQPVTPEGLRTWFNRAAAIMPGANIEAKYEQWRNQGWVPTLPMLRIVRRAIDLGAFTWRTDTSRPGSSRMGLSSRPSQLPCAIGTTARPQLRPSTDPLMNSSS